MAPRIDDRWVWLGFAVFGVIAAYGTRYAMQDIVRLIQIDPSQFEPKNKEEPPENKLSLSELKTLTTSHNPNIANAAISLIVARFARLSNAEQLLQNDLLSSNENTRKSAKHAISFLREWPLPPEFSGYEEIFQSDRDGDDAMSDDSYDPNVIGMNELSRRLREAGGDMDGWVQQQASPRNPIAGWTNVPHERAESGGMEDGLEGMVEVGDEMWRRRRNREAVVVHEGGGEDEEEDVLRPR